MKNPDEPRLMIGKHKSGSDAAEEFKKALQQTCVVAMRTGLTIEGVIVYIEAQAATLHAARPYVCAATDQQRGPT